MKKENKSIRDIQNKIGYEFHNTDLMFQAFIRKSYSEENGGENNEVLEFIGDKVLDFVVVKLLTERNGSISLSNIGKAENLELFTCRYNEGELTEKKRRLVEKKNLAKRMLDLGFSRYLIMSKGDLANEVQFSKSAMEDLFEALIGAVALDSDWDLHAIQNVVEYLLDFENAEEPEEDRYYDYLQQWSMKRYGIMPDVQVTKLDPYETPGSGVYRSDEIRAKWQHSGVMHIADIKKCIIRLSDIPYAFIGYGYSNAEAKEFACEVAYQYLKEKDLLLSIRDEIDNPNWDGAINQLEILARRGYFSIPEYEFEETFDNDGNPVWECQCYIDEVEYYFSAASSSKKDAKKSAAFDMLNYVLEEM